MDLDRLVSYALERFQSPGVAIAMVENDQVTLAKGWGVLRLDSPQPVDEHSLFGIASISKTFTATALAILVGEGLLGWDDLVSRYLPDFRLADIFASAEITVRDLLCHRTGLAEVSGGAIWYGSDLSRAEVVRRLRFLPPQSSFRSRYAYQNVSFLVLGEIIQAITGQSWDQFLRARIFDPLGMTRTTSTIPELAERDNVATPHALINGTVQLVSIRSHDNVGPAASINTSAFELAQYARLHLAGGEYAGDRLFSPQRQAEMWSAHTPIPTIPDVLVPDPLQPQFNAYALGWFVRDFNGRKVVTHSGGVDGYRTLLTLIPSEKLGLIFLSNMESAITHALMVSILSERYGEPKGDWIDAIAQVRDQAQAKSELAARSVVEGRVPGTQPSLEMAGYCGRYLSPLIDWIEVSQVGSGLVLQFAHTAAFTADLSHWHHNTFRLHWRDPYVPAGLVTFQLDGRGCASALELDQPSLLDVDFGELGRLYRQEEAS